ncbi:NADPH-dependent FMN reductase [Olavius algarvensis Delta 1 endosymbiont]|nr:NADPH-dependent FMN reductase [Olavius algarvensis Delta 1 endosymbiont]
MTVSMTDILALYGSPRRRGNTATLLKQAVKGARDAGAGVEEVYLRDLKMSPCLEIYACKNSGQCAIKDDFQKVRDRMMVADGLMLASPIFFYTVSAHTKILMDRCQSMWVEKYWVDESKQDEFAMPRKGFFIAVGATRGKKLFDGALLTVKYFLDTLDMELWKSLLYRGLDFEGDVLKYPEYLDEAYESGKAYALAVMQHQG